jgi:hypothetical protein
MQGSCEYRINLGAKKLIKIVFAIAMFNYFN